MNNFQKLGFFIGVSIVAAVVFLHAPWMGYVTQTDGSIGMFGIFTPPVAFPFLDWMSNGARVIWLVSMGDFLIAVSISIVLTAFWIFLFRSTKSK